MPKLARRTDFIKEALKQRAVIKRKILAIQQEINAAAADPIRREVLTGHKGELVTYRDALTTDITTKLTALQTAIDTNTHTKISAALKVVRDGLQTKLDTKQGLSDTATVNYRARLAHHAQAVAVNEGLTNIISGTSTKNVDFTQVNQDYCSDNWADLTQAYTVLQTTMATAKTALDNAALDGQAAATIALNNAKAALQAKAREIKLVLDAKIKEQTGALEAAQLNDFLLQQKVADTKAQIAAVSKDLDPYTQAISKQKYSKISQWILYPLALLSAIAAIVILVVALGPGGLGGATWAAAIIGILAFTSLVSLLTQQSLEGATFTKGMAPWAITGLLVGITAAIFAAGVSAATVVTPIAFILVTASFGLAILGFAFKRIAEVAAPYMPAAKRILAGLLIAAALLTAALVFGSGIGLAATAGTAAIVGGLFVAIAPLAALYLVFSANSSQEALDAAAATKEKQSIAANSTGNLLSIMGGPSSKLEQDEVITPTTDTPYNASGTADGLTKAWFNVEKGVTFDKAELHQGIETDIATADEKANDNQSLFSWLKGTDNENREAKNTLEAKNPREAKNSHQPVN